jgi:hypothetical protein
MSVAAAEALPQTPSHMVSPDKLSKVAALPEVEK